MVCPLRWLGTPIIFMALFSLLPEQTEGGQLGMQFPKAVPHEKTEPAWRISARATQCVAPLKPKKA